jgi:hypothetical protein
MVGTAAIDKNGGAPREIRTPDHLVRSQVLYPAELWAHCFGGERGIRTLDGILSHTPLAGERLRPLGHLSGCLGNFRVRNYSGVTSETQQFYGTRLTF